MNSFRIEAPKTKLAAYQQREMGNMGGNESHMLSCLLAALDMQHGQQRKPCPQAFVGVFGSSMPNFGLPAHTPQAPSYPVVWLPQIFPSLAL